MKRCGYEGWYVLDIYPYRDDGHAALQEGVDRVKHLMDIAKRIDGEELRKMLRASESVPAQRYLWNSVLK